jgi:hypothetical protein
MIIIHIRKAVPTIHIAKTALQHWPISFISPCTIHYDQGLLTDILLLQPCKRISRRSSLLLIVHKSIALIIDVPSTEQLNTCSNSSSEEENQQNKGKQQYDTWEEPSLSN